MPLPVLMDLSAEQGARQLALSYLEAAARARARLDDAEDPESLHDFRVALRRLRSCLRAYRESLKCVPRKMRRRLQKLARATGSARDAEVQIEWLRRQKPRLKAEQRAGFVWLSARIEARRDQAYREIRKQWLGPFDRIEFKLRDALDEHAELPHDENPMLPVSFAHVTGECLQQYCAELNQELIGIGSKQDRKAIHAARIRGKRLRYLLEPLTWAAPKSKALVKTMKSFQDRLGELCDAQVFEGEIAQAVEIAGAERALQQMQWALAKPPRRTAEAADLFPGLLMLARRVTTQETRIFREVQQTYLGDAAGSFLQPFSELGRRLCENTLLE